MSVLTPGWNNAAFGVLADVLGHLETAERAASLGVRLAFRSALPVEVRHLLNEVMILQQDGAVGADGERVLIAGDWNAGVGCRGFLNSARSLAERWFCISISE
jgi:hypothetical protein